VRSVLITGASRGIGRAAALRLAKSGWEVYAGVRSPADGDALTAEPDAKTRITPVMLDVTDPAQVAALTTALPDRLDAVVNNAGIVVDGPVESLTPERLRDQFDVNVVGAVAVTNAVLPKLRAAGGGRVVFISSVSGRISTPMTGAYNASKFAVEAIADALRLELRPWGIKVIVVEPNSTDTDLWRGAGDTLETTVAGLEPEHARLYAKHIDGMRSAVKMIQRLAVPVDQVSDTIELALTAPRPKARYPVGLRSKVQLALDAVTPTRINDVVLARATGVPRRPPA
jgi:NAD(P)-dependent dehydrogenase (short-subunit alcohol dehydrogenase family)